jgi:predicted hotdog family 3-hydroxylacyl-ACP dehydratase
VKVTLEKTASVAPGVINAATIKATIVIPGDGPWFAGHFPGRPILPGVAELALAIAALRQKTGRPLPLRGITFARLRQLVLPGDRLELTAGEDTAQQGEASRLRFGLKRDGLPVANGEFIFGAPLPAITASTTAARGETGERFPAPQGLLPQQPPMSFLTAILGQNTDTLDATARIPQQCALVCDGAAPALALIESAAQAAAAWEALRRRNAQGDAAPRVGYLVAMRDVDFFTEQIAAEQEFVVSVALEAAAPPLTHYRFEASLQGAVLARGTLATFLSG